MEHITIVKIRQFFVLNFEQALPERQVMGPKPVCRPRKLWARSSANAAVEDRRLERQLN